MLLASKLSNIWSTWISFLSLKTFGKCENEICDRHILKIGQMCHLVWTCSSHGFLRLCKQTFFSLLSICSVAWMNLWVACHSWKTYIKRITWEVMNCFIITKSNMICMVQSILMLKYVIRWHYLYLIWPFK